MKNLVVAVVGDTSLHHNWLGDNQEFDLFVVYYGQHGGKYRREAKYYDQLKGTKFNIVGALAEKWKETLGDYNYIFVPDDDLYIQAEGVNRLFRMASNHDLDLCQPSILGHYSLPVTLHTPSCYLRYTNYVEIMCPCFSKTAFDCCIHTFTMNKSCWGIDALWTKLLGFPKDKIAVIDDVIAVHTRACFCGDNYSNNNVADPMQDVYKIMEEHNLSWDKSEIGRIPKDLSSLPHSQRIYPETDLTRKWCQNLYEGKRRQVL